MGRVTQGVRVELLEPRVLLSDGPVGLLVTPAPGEPTNIDRGYVDVSWIDPSGSGLRLNTIDKRDITITGVSVNSVARVADDVWRYSYSGSLTEGIISVDFVASQVKNNDNVGNTSRKDTFTFDITGPWVLTHDPSGTAGAGLDHVRFTFSEPMAADSLSIGDDVVHFTGPTGNLKSTIAGFEWLENDTRLEVRFSPLSIVGEYELAIGPQIQDRAGNAMDQDRDGTEGEPVDDVYIAGFSVERGIIAGRLWHDLNGNGQVNSGEPPLSGWTVYLEQNRDRVRDPGEVFTTTDADGWYRFRDLSAGIYYVAAEPPIGWELTYPTASNRGLVEATVQPSTTGLSHLDLPITFTGSDTPVHVPSDVAGDVPIQPADAEANSLIRLNSFRADARFAGIDGSGYSVVIIDTGIHLNHSYFGDRIVYHYDFADNDADASDVNGHGTHVASIAAGSPNGVAPGANIIALKVFTNSGSGTFEYVEEALQWVVANAEAYNIVAVNMSLSDAGNHATARQRYGIWDELAALAAKNVIVVSASGNDYFNFGSVEGVGYPAADPNSLAIGAVYDANVGNNRSYTGGATDYATAADRLASFSQRSSLLTDVFAPGAVIVGASRSGGTESRSGTSMATPYVAGLAVLAQQLAMQHLGRRLTPFEFRDLIRDSGVIVYDGDDEYNNVVPTHVDYFRIDVHRLADFIYEMPPGEYYPEGHKIVLLEGELRGGADFGARLRDTRPGTPRLHEGSDTGALMNDRLTNLNNSSPDKRLLISVPGVIAGATVFLYADGALIGEAVATGSTAAILTNGEQTLPDGVRQITARQVVPGWAMSEASSALSITIDATPPPVPAPPLLISASDSGISNSDRITNISTPTFTFSTETTYRFYRDGLQMGFSNYNWGTSITMPPTVDGVIEFIVGAVDAAGNESFSAPTYVTIDTMAPVPPGQVVPGTLDASFGTGGVAITAGLRDEFRALAEQPDGKVIAVGTVLNPAKNDLVIGVFRFNSDGTLDTTFGNGGFLMTALGDRSVANTVAVQPDGKIVVGGVAYVASGGFYWPRLALIRYNPNGTFDTTFGTGGVFLRDNTNQIRELVILPNGKILAALDAGNGFGLIRFNPNGAPDTTFGNNGIVAFPPASFFDLTSSLTVQPDGKLLISGYVSINNVWHIQVIRALPDGTIDTTFGAGGKVLIEGYNDSAAARVLSDGRIVFVARVDNMPFLFCLRPDGSLDSSFGTGGSSALPRGSTHALYPAVTVQQDDKILVAGSVVIYKRGSARSGVVLRFNPDGSADSTFARAGITASHISTGQESDFLNAALVQSDGNILAAGRMEFPLDRVNSYFPSHATVARFNGGSPQYGMVTLRAEDDTGVSDSDNITSKNLLTFDLPPLGEEYARIYRDGALISGFWHSAPTFAAPHQPEGTSVYTTTLVDAAGNESLHGPQLWVTVDRTLPLVESSHFHFQTAQQVHIRFSEDVWPTISSTNLQLQPLSGGSAIVSSTVSWDASSRTAVFGFAQLLPDGIYRSTLIADGVTDLAGNDLADDHVLDFFVLAGDANRNGRVDIADLGILAANWQKTGMTFSEGDFNYDGIVNIADLGILAANWQVDLFAGSSSIGSEPMPSLAEVLARMQTDEPQVPMYNDEPVVTKSALPTRENQGRGPAVTLPPQSRAPRGLFGDEPVGGRLAELLDEEPDVLKGRGARR